jgi:hypothetical protein
MVEYVFHFAAIYLTFDANVQERSGTSKLGPKSSNATLNMSILFAKLRFEVSELTNRIYITRNKPAVIEIRSFLSGNERQ